VEYNGTEVYHHNFITMPTAEMLIDLVKENLMTEQEGGMLINMYGLTVSADAVLQPGKYTFKFYAGGESGMDCAQRADTSAVSVFLSVLAVMSGNLQLEYTM